MTKNDSLESAAPIRVMLKRSLARRAPDLAAWVRWQRDRRRDMAHRIAEEQVTSTDVVLDVGAANGDWTCRLARIARHVHAFEPLPEHAARLREIAAKRQNATFHPFALSDQSGAASIYIPSVAQSRRNCLARLDRPEAGEFEEVKIETRTLDSLELAAVHLVKCDVEGHELSVIDGGEGSLREHRPKLLIEIEQRHMSAPISTVFDAIYALGYTQGWAVGLDRLFPLDEFDVDRDQLFFVNQVKLASGWVGNYVNDFMFE